MNDDDIAKLALKLSVNLASKDDLNGLATKADLKKLETKVARGFKDLNQKFDKVLEYADAIDQAVTNDEKRLTKIEAIPAIAQKLN